jgi:ketosteroid isomerase-like protein
MNAGVAPRDKLRAAYQAWHETKGGSIETWLALVADEVQFRSLADGAAHATWTKQRSTREEVRGYLQELTRSFTMLEFRADRFVNEGDTVVMIGWCRWLNNATKKVASTPKVDVWRFDAAGQAIEFTEYYDTAGLAAACQVG